MDSAFQYPGLCEVNTLNTLNWCRVSRETLVKWNKGEIICHFLSVCVRQFPSPTEEHICPWWLQECQICYRRPRGCGATRGMSTTILPRLLKHQTTPSHSWPAANHTWHQTVLRNAARDASESCLPWPRESIWTLPVGKRRWNAAVLQGPRELIRNHTVMDSQNGLGYEGRWW